MPLAPYTLEQAEQDISDLRGLVDRLLEAHTFADGPTPNTPDSSGVTAWSGSGNLALMNSSGLQGNVPQAQTAFFPNNTVVNGTSLTNLAQGTYKGNDADVGATYETEVWGNGVQGSTAQTLQFGVVLGGTTLANLTFGTTAFGSPAASVIFRWWGIARVTCVTTGGSGTWRSLVLAKVNAFTGNLAPGNSNQASGTSTESTSTTVKDTTVDQTVSLSAVWGSTTGAPTLTSQVAFFKRVC